MNPIDNAIKEMVNYQFATEKTIKDMVERNAKLTKVIAIIRSLLERSLKNPSNINAAVYETIDLCRANFVYTDYSSGHNKIDPPLTEAEKILP
jgi:hypothetical protein